MKVKRVRIASEFRINDDRTRCAVADFQLGLGPCGKEVTALTCDPSDPPGFCVTQTTSDGEIKAFIYPVDTLTGRVEITYGS